VNKYDEVARKFTNKSGIELKWGTKLELPGAMDLIQVDDVKSKLDLLMQSTI
jgi:heptosyltransferase I